MNSNPPPRARHYSEKLAVGVTPEQRRRLEEILRARARVGQMSTLAEVLRAAVSLYIAQQDDIPGTRAAITRKLEGRFEAVEERLGSVEAKLTEQAELLARLVEFFRKRSGG